MATSCADTSQINLLRWGLPIGCADAMLEELGYDALHEAMLTIIGGEQDDKDGGGGGGTNDS
eukprot:1995228-Pyramimonas_sp.AAC.1